MLCFTQNWTIIQTKEWFSWKNKFCPVKFLTFKATKTCCKMTLWWFMHYCRVGVRWDLHDTVLGDSRAEALWVGSATKMCFLSSVQFLCRTKMCTIEDFTLCRGALGGCEHHNRFILWQPRTQGYTVCERWENIDCAPHLVSELRKTIHCTRTLTKLFYLCASFFNDRNTLTLCMSNSG